MSMIKLINESVIPQRKLNICHFDIFILTEEKSSSLTAIALFEVRNSQGRFYLESA